MDFVFNWASKINPPSLKLRRGRQDFLDYFIWITFQMKAIQPNPLSAEN
jgi:hypothetical protein